jgi:threonine/homoserine/homoserine lactone efflux protein
MLDNCRLRTRGRVAAAPGLEDFTRTIALSLLPVIFIKAVLAGFAIAMPVGPVGVMCVRRTIDHGRVAGLVAGLGAALADAVYGVVAAFGLVAVKDWLLEHRTLLELIGGSLLILLALRIVLRHTRDEPRRADPQTHLAAFASTFVLTITNPITILAFAAVFTTLGLGVESLDLTDSAVLVGGVFLGSAVWWIGLAAGAGLLRNRMSDDIMHWLDRCAAVVLGGFGLFALVSALS